MPDLEHNQLIYATVLRPWLLSDVETPPEGAIGPVSAAGISNGAGTATAVGFQIGSTGTANAAGTATAVSQTLENETTSWISAVESAGGSVSSARRLIVDDLIAGLKADSLWTKLDRLWIFAAENTQSALIDLKALDTATNNNADFTADQGYTGSSFLERYVDTTFNPNTHGSQYTTNSASLFGWNRTGRAGDNFGLAGCASDNGSVYILPLDINDEVKVIINSEQDEALGGVGSSGFFHVTRTGAFATETFHNGSSLSTGAAGATISRPNLNIYVCAINDHGFPDFIATDQIACVGMGAGMNSTEASNLYSRINTYMMAIDA